MSRLISSVQYWEAPYVYWRWAVLSAVSACADRRFHVTYMGDRLYTNMFMVLVGDPSTKKNTVLKHIKSCMIDAGYTNFAPDTMHHTQFCKTLISGNHNSLKSRAKNVMNSPQFTGFEFGAEQDTLDLDELAIESSAKAARFSAGSMCISSFEFADIFESRKANQSLRMLQQLWDNPMTYDTQFGIVLDPYISMVTATNPIRIDHIFADLAELQGFISRTVFVYSDPSGRILSPYDVKFDKDVYDEMVDVFRFVIESEGAMSISQDAKDMLFKIACTVKNSIRDYRFIHYLARRDVHLTKLSMTVALMEKRTNVTVNDVAYAHTLLAFTESSMTSAVGEFGTNRNAKLVAAVKDVLTKNYKGLTYNSLSAQVRTMVANKGDLQATLVAMASAGLITKAENSEIWCIVPSGLNQWRGNPHVFPYLLEEWSALSD